MKTPEELSALKKEYETLTQKLRELTDEELEQVVSGNAITVKPFAGAEKGQVVDGGSSSVAIHGHKLDLNVQNLDQ